MKNGAIVHAEASWAYPQGAPFKMAFEVVGTKGQLEYDNQKDASMGLQTIDEGVFVQKLSSPDANQEEPYYAELRNFINHVIYDEALVVTPEQAYESLKVALAAKKSSEENRPIDIEKEF